MTRGKLVLITNALLISSCEFNGDMYMDKSGYGQEAIAILLKTNTVDEFKAACQKFNADHYGYEEDYAESYSEWHGEVLIEDALDFTRNYFDNWFSDYLYIKNASDRIWHIKGNNGEVGLEPGEVVAVCFGDLIGYAKDCPTPGSMDCPQCGPTPELEEDEECVEENTDDEYDDEENDEEDAEIKAFRIIKEKHVDVHWIYESDNVDEYNNHHGWHKLTKEEFNFLKKTVTA